MQDCIRAKKDGYSSLFKLMSNPSSSKILVLRSYPFQGKTIKVSAIEYFSTRE